MSNMSAVLSVFFFMIVFGLNGFAGFQAYQNTTSLGVVGSVKCSTGLTCTKASGKLVIVSSPTITGTSLSLSSTLAVTGATTLTGGMTVSSGQKTRFISWAPPTLTSGTSTTPSATTVYLTQVFVPSNATITGVKVNNGATVGTNKYIVALFNSAGTAVANSALAGATTAGADAYQTIAFTGTYAAVGPAVYWIALYVDGITDRFRSIPAVGEFAGLAGSVTGQTFGTVAALTLPTTFTADKGPVAFLY